MNIVAIDDEKLAVESLIGAIKDAEPTSTITGFSHSEDLLSFVEQNPIDIAFLDIEMRDTNGIALAKKLKLLKPLLNIIFVTGYSEYATEAFQLHVSGYVQKPATKQKIEQEIKNLRHPIIPPTEKSIKVQCFGNFEIFVSDIPVKFKYLKTKEICAFLIDRKGASVTNGEIMATLWEDDAKTKESYFRNLVADLQNTFSLLGYSDIVVKQRGSISIVTEKITCDYYDWNKGLPYAINLYQGEYMTQYSWAESTLGSIEFSLR